MLKSHAGLYFPRKNGLPRTRYGVTLAKAGTAPEDPTGAAGETAHQS